MLNEITLSTYALAAIASHLQSRMTETQAGVSELQFLAQQLERVAMNSNWLKSLHHYLQHPSDRDLPLLQLAYQLNLTPIELLTVALATTVEEDAMVGRALAYLQAPLGGSRPTLGLLASVLVGTVEPNVHPLNYLMTGIAVQSGLLQILQESSPIAERVVSIPFHLWLALRGHDSSLPSMTIDLDEHAIIPLPESIVTEAQQRASSLSSTQRVLLLRTGSIAEGKSVVQTIAQTLNRRPLFIETEPTIKLDPWLLLRQLLPVFCFELAPGERKILPRLPFYQDAILVICGPDGSVEALDETVLSWSLPVPNPEERHQLWTLALGATDLAKNLAHNHRHSSGRIAQLSHLIHYYATFNGHSQPDEQDAIAASRTDESIGLDALAQPLPAQIPDEALVMSSILREELQFLVLRCRSRDRLVNDLGASAKARYHPGVCALFVGPSGTGKTLAAGWLATQLGMPLYRVDLAAITSKYIGETEKNLAQLLARSEQAEVVLLFDEADSLFGKRTDIKEANDRFANAQTNYLLQRIESFDGITILTSNSRSRFDAAFSRRLDMIIEFPLPGPEERRSLWQSHLGTHHHLTPKELNQLATTIDVSGGHIRNAVLAAAVLAHDRAIEFTDVIQGLSGEYRKLGRQLPLELNIKP